LKEVINMNKEKSNKVQNESVNNMNDAIDKIKGSKSLKNFFENAAILFAEISAINASRNKLINFFTKNPFTGIKKVSNEIDKLMKVSSDQCYNFAISFDNVLNEIEKSKNSKSILKDVNLKISEINDAFCNNLIGSLKKHILTTISEKDLPSLDKYLEKCGLKKGNDIPKLISSACGGITTPSDKNKTYDPKLVNGIRSYIEVIKKENSKSYHSSVLKSEIENFKEIYNGKKSTRTDDMTSKPIV